MELVDFRQSHILLKDYFVTAYPREEIPLEADILRMLKEKGFLPDPVPLEDLHLHLPSKFQALNEYYMNPVSMAFYQMDSLFLHHYQKLICYLAEKVFDFDFLFQERPIIRFHFPVLFPEKYRISKDRAVHYHSDTMGGHPLELVQAWLALTDCFATNTLHVSSREEGISILEEFSKDFHFDAEKYFQSLHHFTAKLKEDEAFGEKVFQACKPVEMKAGEILIFDPRCVHGGRENQEEKTRVTIDFRLLPLEAHEKLFARGTNPYHSRFTRGDVLHSLSAREFAKKGI